MKIDKASIYEKAEQSLLSGPVTNDYALDPKRACEILNNALASEILCVLRYRSHQILAKSIHAPAVAKEFEEHAKNEEEHMLLLAERIDQLGGEPNFDPIDLVERSVTSYGSAKSLLGMIRDDLVAERIVISLYREMILWFSESDPTSRRMLESILADEEEHASDLSDLLALEQVSSGSVNVDEVA